MNRLKVMTVVGTRPEIIRLSEVMKQLDSCESINHIVVHTGQNYDYELNEIFFNELGLRKPDYFLNAANGTAIETIGNILVKIEPILSTVNPDAFLVLGDTNSCLSAIAAKRRHIPIFHMEAGNRCFDQRVPEEINRRIVDHISDINLPYSDISREYLIREGISPDRIIKTGSPMYEVLNKNMENINKSSILKKLGLERNQYFLVSCHREENVNSPHNLGRLISILNTLVDLYQLPIVFSTHPRTRKVLSDNKYTISSLVKFEKPFGYFDYIHLQQNAFVVLSDSGTISEEASILGFKALNIRESHERPEAMEEVSAMMVGLNIDRVLQAIKVLEGREGPCRLVRDYSMPNVSHKVMEIILSYTDYINRLVWSKN